MKRVIGIAAALLLGAGALVFGVAAGDSGQYRIRAIFDNANQLAVGEQVRVAGVTVGVVEHLGVTDDNKAAVTIRIDNPGYTDFRTDSNCIIRPQSLIGEQFVDCSPTKPRAPGQSPAPELSVIQSGSGEGDRLMPVQNTSSPVGIDLINNIMRVPERQRFAIILNEFGTALAGNGQTLNTVIRRANPALQETDKVLAILAGQNKTLENLAVNSDASLAPLARDRASVAAFIRNSEVVSRASAAKGQALQANFQKFPAFLQQLTPTMNELGNFSQALEGFLQPLQGHEAAINGVVKNLPAFANNSTGAFVTLGNPLATTGSTVFTDPVVLGALAKTKQLAAGLNPFANGLGSLLQSLQKTGGWEFLMQTLYSQVAAGNGFNKYGHYVRGELLLYPIGACATTEAGRGSTYGSCSANFDGGNDPSVGAGMASIGKVARAGNFLTNFASQAVIAKPFGWEFWGKKPAAPAPAVVKAPTTAKAPAPTLTTTPAVPPAATDTPATGADGKSAMLKYLLGGGSR